MNERCRECKFATCNTGVADGDSDYILALEYCTYPSLGIGVDVDGTAYLNEVTGGRCPMKTN